MPSFQVGYFRGQDGFGLLVWQKIAAMEKVHAVARQVWTPKERFPDPDCTRVSTERPAKGLSQAIAILLLSSTAGRERITLSPVQTKSGIEAKNQAWLSTRCRRVQQIGQSPKTYRNAVPSDQVEPLFRSTENKYMTQGKQS